MYTDFPDPLAPHIMMLSERGTTSGDRLVERVAVVFDVLSMKPDLDAGDSDHVRHRTSGSVSSPRRVTRRDLLRLSPVHACGRDARARRSSTRRFVSRSRCAKSPPTKT